MKIKHESLAKRLSHSEKEKVRRDKINHNLTLLRRLVPELHLAGASEIYKLDILEKTIVYIKELHYRIEKKRIRSNLVQINNLIDS
ncbi:hypothetical protein HDV04_005565 [Boothiomyces sp. JEL0838]|nr:hypothetical protein HDV04_005565 [Boothiomyces sp. JEL0838]